MSTDRKTKGRNGREGKRAGDARGKGIPPIQGCRQEGCSSSAINLTCTMAERARSRSSLDEENQAGIISFVHRLPGEDPSHREGWRAGRSISVGSGSDNAGEDAVIKEAFASFFTLPLALVPTYEQSARSRVLRSAQCAHPGSSRPSIARPVIATHTIEKNAGS